jgi:hypothetical protein
MCNESGTPESKLGLDHNRNVIEKLFRTVVLLVFAGFLATLTGLAVALIADPWVRFAVESVLEVCWLFWFLAIIFVWWNPRWLRSRYLHAESRMLRLATVLKFAVLVLIVIAVVFITYLIQSGVLPLEPK